MSVFAWLLNSVLGEGLVKHAPNVISKKSFMSFLVDLKSKSADSWFHFECFQKYPKTFHRGVTSFKVDDH